MEWLLDIYHQFKDLANWVIQSFGYAGVWAIVFAESGLFFGFFLPGDSLLLLAGLYSSKGLLNISVLTVGIIIAAILGDQAGYWTGKRLGPGVVENGNRWIRKEHIDQAKDFFERQGPWAIILARFTPAVRTFTPIVAGAVGMNYRVFVTFNIIGGILWGGGVTLLGFWIGSSLGKEMLEKVEVYILLTIVLISFIPIIREIIHTRTKRKSVTPPNYRHE